jgi:zinc transport system substrate-binding protein
MPKSLRTALFAATALTVAAPLHGSVHAQEAPGVAASIKPVHSLVAAVMDGVGDPHLVVSGGASPHTYSLRPSDATALQEADVVFWVGPDLETFLQAPIATLAAGAAVVELAEADGLVRLPYREGGPFAGHDHDHGDAADAAAAADDGHGDDHGHDDGHGHDDHDHGHDDHDHDDHGHDDHGHDDHGHDDHGHDDHGHGHDHGHGSTDMHLWLDPQNAEAFAEAVVAALAEADPANAEAYRANGEALAARLDALTAELEATLEPVHDRPFVVFHDAYQYLEHRFDLNTVGSITVSPDVQPGAQRLAEIQHTIEELGAVCVFAEPQFEPRLVEVVTAGTGARPGVLDPLGADLPDGPDLYFDLMRRNARALADCLAGAG